MNKTQQMFSLVENWQVSGLSRKAFCEQEGITVFKFNYWAAKLKKDRSVSGGFIRLQPQVAGSGYEITYPSGVKLHVEDADLATLSQLLRL